MLELFKCLITIRMPTTAGGNCSCFSIGSCCVDSCSICGPPPILKPLCLDTGDVIDGNRGDCDIDDGRWGCA